MKENRKGKREYNEINKQPNAKQWHKIETDWPEKTE